MYKIRFLSVGTFLCLLLCFSSVKAQLAIPCTGGIANGTGGSATFSIGQVNYITNLGANGTVCQGVQHAFEIFVVSGFEDVNYSNIQLLVYPNPTNDYLKLQVNASNVKCRVYQVLDSNGKLISAKLIENSETIIDLVNCASAIYYINIIEEEKILKTFKVIKN